MRNPYFSFGNPLPHERPQDDLPPSQPQPPTHHEPEVVAADEGPRVWTPTEYLAIRRLRMRREREDREAQSRRDAEQHRLEYGRYLYDTGRIGEGGDESVIPHG